MWDGFNKRKFPRLNLQCQIDIHSEDPKVLIHAVTENIGIGGVCLILDKTIERFSKCRVKLDLKDGDPFLCDGKVVWIVPTSDSKSTKKKFDVGIEFEGIEPQQTAQLRSFIEKELAGQA